MAQKRSKGEFVPRASAGLIPEQIAKLRDLFPEAVSEGRVDFERLRATLGEIVDDRPERYSFTWAGKRDAIRLLQTPSRATLVPAPDESVDFDSTNNVFIEGENLEVLKLLYKSYAGRIKMIYIDPPYNTGNDFIYPDNFADPLETYLKLTGQKSAEGNLLTSNPETSGRYHSAWLSMMYPRLFLARQLLREDGVIFVSIDDHEIHNLRCVMDEVFGPECFKNCVIVGRGAKSVQAQFETIDALASGHEYILLYSRNPGKRFKHYAVELEEAKEGTWNNHWRGTDRPTMRYELLGIRPRSGQWRWGKERSLKALNNYEQLRKDLGIKKGEFPEGAQVDTWCAEQTRKTEREIDLLRLSRNGKPEHYIPPTDTKLGSDIWTDISCRGSSELEALFGSKVFDNPKPVKLICRMLEWIIEPDENAIVLDFFPGSCTAAQAVLELNRQDGGNRCFVMAQLPEPSEHRKFPTIAEIGKERIRRVISNLRSDSKEQQGLFKDRRNPEDFGFRVFKLAESHCRPWRGVGEKDGEQYAEEMALFTDPLLPGWKPVNVIHEVALKEGFSLTCRIEKQTGIKTNAVYRVTDAERGQEFRICLDAKFDARTAKALELKKEDILICRDTALTDELAANLALQCRLKTI